MKKLTYSLAAIGIIVVTVLITFFRNSQSPLPPWDRSSEYKYHTIDGAIYLQVVRHNEYIFVSQYGVWLSSTPDLVKRSEKHNEARSLREIKSDEEFEKAKLAFLEWEEKYNNDEGNRIDLTKPQESHMVPQNLNPYDWKPNEDSVSFRDYYIRNKEDGFLQIDFYDKNDYL